VKVEEVANELGISTRSVYRLIECGLLPATNKVIGHKPIYGYDVDVEVVKKVIDRLPAKYKATMSHIKIILGGLSNA
jgi:hypothetical protein